MIAHAPGSTLNSWLRLLPGIFADGDAACENDDVESPPLGRPGCRQRVRQSDFARELESQCRESATVWPTPRTDCPSFILS